MVGELRVKATAAILPLLIPFVKSGIRVLAGSEVSCSEVR